MKRNIGIGTVVIIGLVVWYFIRNSNQQVTTPASTDAWAANWDKLYMQS